MFKDTALDFDCFYKFFYKTKKYRKKFCQFLKPQLARNDCIVYNTFVKYVYT